MLNKLTKIVKKSKKRVGRGHSSGLGKTSGRGYKGQKSRGTVKLGFEGGQLPLSKRLPQKRGIGNSLHQKKVTLTLNDLERVTAKEVTVLGLIKEGLLKKSDIRSKIKIVDSGTISKPLTVKIPTTPSATSKIEKVGGKVEI